MYTNYSFADAIENGDLDSQSLVTMYNVDSTDHLVFASVLLFFATCLSVVSTLCAYYLFTEDQILRKFVSDGIKLDAKVVEYTLTNRSRQQYTATIDYRYNYDSKTTKVYNAKETDEEAASTKVKYTTTAMDNYFPTIIRKQIKCVESDFVLRRHQSDFELHKSTNYANTRNNERIRNNISPSKQQTSTTSLQQYKPQSIWIEIRKDLHSDDNQYSYDVDEKFPSFDVAMFNAPQQYYVNVVVLPDHPISAIGCEQLMQSLNHCPFILLIASLLTLAYFCVYISIVNVVPGRGISFGLSRSFVILLVLILTETMILQCCCRDMILDVLTNEYELHTDDSKNDNYFRYKTEDETLYTMPSSFGGTGVGLPSTASVSWKHSSPNICSIQLKQQHQLSGAPSPRMEDLILDY